MFGASRAGNGSGERTAPKRKREVGESIVAERGAGPMRVVVIGAGLTGLTAAYRAHRMATTAGEPIDLVVLEANDRVGGAIWTTARDGFTLEGGADSFITNKPWGVELCEELGLSDRLISADVKNRRSFVVRDGKLHPVPEGFVLMAPAKLGPFLTTPILSLPGKLRALFDLFIPRKRDDADESLASFVKRRFGREVLDRLVQPLVGGIYTADPIDLSLKATLPQFLGMEKEYGGLIRAGLSRSRRDRAIERESSGARYGLFVTPSEGMAVLPKTLADSLPAGSIRLSTPVRRVGRVDSGRTGEWRVELLDGRPLDCDRLVIATEAHASARLLDAFDAELAMQLRSIPYASSVIVQLAYRRDQVSHPLDGFGVVVPRIEGRSILAISFPSVKFPCRAPAGTVLFRVFLGGATQPELFDLDDDELQVIVRAELRSLLGVDGEPILVEIARHARAMPQYNLGHLDRVAAIRALEASHPGLILAGNAFSGVGVPDCIRSGELAAETALAETADPAAPAAA